MRSTQTLITKLSGGLALMTMTLIPVGGCDDGDGGTAGAGGAAGSVGGAGGEGGGLDRRQVLVDIGEHVILPAYRDFLEKAQALAGAMEALEAAGAEDEAAMAAARESFLAAMGSWQQAELMQVGPAGRDGVRLGGQSLRDEIYSWPTVNPCRVDQELVEGEYDDDGFFEGALVNVYGLDAIEYLLFQTDTANSCPAPVPINAQGTWAALGDGEVRARRVAYAAAASRWLVNRAQALVDAWEPAGGNFLGAFTDPGSGGSPYADVQTALNELFAAMFYLDQQVKDAKLGTPAGLTLDCMEMSCPERLESPWARQAGANIGENLDGFELLFTAGARNGFEELLIDAGAADLAAEIVRLTRAAQENNASTGADLLGPLEADVVTLQNAHADVKAITVLLKSQMVTVLNLSVPQEGASDND